MTCIVAVLSYICLSRHRLSYLIVVCILVWYINFKKLFTVSCMPVPTTVSSSFAQCGRPMGQTAGTV